MRLISVAEARALGLDVDDWGGVVETPSPEHDVIYVGIAGGICASLDRRASVVLPYCVEPDAVVRDIPAGMARWSWADDVITVSSARWSVSAPTTRRPVARCCGREYAAPAVDCGTVIDDRQCIARCPECGRALFVAEWE